MYKDTKIRLGWLKFMYFYTIVGAGGFGLGMIFVPGVILPAFRFPAQDPVVLGIVGSSYVAFGLASVLGLRAPLKFAPLLLLQLTYKIIWSIVVAIPLLLSKGLPVHAILLLVIFSTYIIGDLIAVPFSYVFSRHE